MIIPAKHLLRSIQEEFAKIRDDLPDAHTDGSSAQAIESSLALLVKREEEGTGFVRTQLSNLSSTLSELLATASEHDSVPPSFTESISALLADVQNHDVDAPLHRQEFQWLDIIRRFERIVANLAERTDLDNAARLHVSRVVSVWEAGDLASHLSDSTTAPEASGTLQDAITPSSLAGYLRDRFDDDGLEVTHVHQLAGGFGKETTLFSVSGTALSGDFVIRRDYGLFPVPNDCHQVAVEYPVIRAAFEKGFPAPDAVWLDTEHTRLRGGDFIVMRRSPGATGGNVFSAQTEVSGDLIEVLAKSVASLHLLPPLEALGDLTSSIRRDSWAKPIHLVVDEYLNEWYQIFTHSSHTPSAAIASLFGWLRTNRPSADGRPVLLHGDIGFHNMIIDRGQLTALVDWEFAHVGDPAEDLGYLRNCTGGTLDWNRFLEIYDDITHFAIPPERIRYFQVWGHVRNAVASNLAATNFADGNTTELKLAHLLFHHTANFIRLAQQFTEEPDD